MASKQKPQKVLEPKIEKVEGQLTDKELEDLSKSMNNFHTRGDDRIQIVESTNNSMDTYFSTVLQELNSEDGVSMKTEYFDETTVFAVAKGDFLSQFCNIPSMKRFLELYKINMVSKGRKGRTEIVLGLEKRQDHVQSVAMQSAGIGAPRM